MKYVFRKETTAFGRYWYCGPYPGSSATYYWFLSNFKECVRLYLK